MSVLRYELKDSSRNFANDFMNGMRTASALKTAKLNQEKKQRTMDKEDAGTELREVYATGEEAELEASIGEVTNQLKDYSEEEIQWFADSEAVEEGEVEYEEDAPRRKYNELKDKSQKINDRKKRVNKIKALAPKVDAELIATAKQAKFKTGMKKRFIAQGVSPEEANLLANGSIDEIQKVEQWVKTANENDKMQRAEMISDVNTEISSIMELPPEQQQQSFQTKMQGLDVDIEEAEDSGNSKRAKILKNIKKQMPTQFSNQWATNYIMTSTQKFDVLKANLQSTNKKKEATHSATMNAPKVITVGDKDISYKPDNKTGVYKQDKEETSNSILKEKAKKSGIGSYKSADWSLLHRQTIAQETGLDIESDDLIKNYSKLSQDKREKINKLEAKASKIAKDSGGTITMAEALEMATGKRNKMVKANTPIKEGTKGVNKNKEPVIYTNGKWVVQ